MRKRKIVGVLLLSLIFPVGVLANVGEEEIILLPQPVEETPAPGLKPGAFGYKVAEGKVSLQAREADLRKVLEGIGGGAGITAAIGTEVAGQVTAVFCDLPLREALDRLAGDYPVSYDYAYGSEDRVVVRVIIGEVGIESRTPARDDRWQVYLNDERGFFCEYPESWKAWTVVANPGSPDGVIKEKIEFRGPDGPLFWLDVWENSEGRDLMDWFRTYAYQLLSDPAAAARVPETAIGGYPALVVIDKQNMSCDSLITVMPRGDLIFTLTYPSCDRASAKAIYDHLLATFEVISPGGGVQDRAN